MSTSICDFAGDTLCFFNILHDLVFNFFHTDFAVGVCGGYQNTHSLPRSRLAWTLDTDDF